MRVLDAALSAVWAMEEQALRGLLEIASRENEVTPEALSAYRDDRLADAERATFRDGVAILHVDGPLFKRANLFTAFSGATCQSAWERDPGSASNRDPSLCDGSVHGG